jgi:diguanylate cyclase (GGDEF)-like protein
MPTSDQTHSEPGFVASWLAPTALVRARGSERIGRLDLTARITGALSAGVLIWCAFDRGGWALVALITIAAALTLGPLAFRSGIRPEYWSFATGELAHVTAAIAAAMTGGPFSPIAYLLLVGLAVDAMRGVPRATAVSWLVVTVTFIAACLLHSPTLITHHLLETTALLVAMVGVTLAATTLASSEIAYRSASVLDPLTGLLNRSALEERFLELGEQARLVGAPISLVLFDLDRFKAINDRYGHDVGDQILREVAYQVRKSLRQFELVYRMGGEEFLIILPGVDRDQGALTAEQLRETLGQVRLEDGVSVTASFGVTCGAGEAIDFASLYHEADQALYQAKRAGRDRVSAPSRAAAPAIA